jgi:hypothetical protein
MWGEWGGGEGAGDWCGGRLLVAVWVWYSAMAWINMGRHKHWLFFSPRLPTHSPEDTHKKVYDRKRREQITELG